MILKGQINLGKSPVAACLGRISKANIPAVQSTSGNARGSSD